MHEMRASAFAATLSARDRRLASRLEGFGDIVFGFAISQCALQLPTVHGHVDLLHPTALALYFATFALIASLWLVFHRLMSGTFLPVRFDLVLALAYLAFVSLFPYAMFAMSHSSETLASARIAVAEYFALYALTMSIAATISLRNLRRGSAYVSADERDQMWSAFLRQTIVASEMLVALVLDATVGPSIAALVLLTIPLAMRCTRSVRAPARFGEHAPSG